MAEVGTSCLCDHNATKRMTDKSMDAGGITLLDTAIRCPHPYLVLSLEIVFVLDSNR